MSTRRSQNLTPSFSDSKVHVLSIQSPCRVLSAHSLGPLIHGTEVCTQIRLLSSLVWCRGEDVSGWGWRFQEPGCLNGLQDNARDLRPVGRGGDTQWLPSPVSLNRHRCLQTLPSQPSDLWSDAPALQSRRPPAVCDCPRQRRTERVLTVELPWVQAQLPRGRPGMSLHLSEPP